MFRRLIRLPERPRESFFLWGPRQTGKSALLKALYPQAIRVDLAKTEDFVRYSERPALLRDVLENSPPDPVVVIDEIQKVPPLLEEVRWLAENRGRVFAMSGSSARAVRQAAPALPPGRVARFDLFGLTSAEIGRPFDLCRMLNHGYLPRHYLADSPARPLRAYVESYLKEEALLSGLTRSLRAFSDFLTAVASVGSSPRLRSGPSAASSGRPSSSWPTSGWSTRWRGAGR